jgi:hypothetical protein
VLVLVPLPGTGIVTVNIVTMVLQRTAYTTGTISSRYYRYYISTGTTIPVQKGRVIR